MSESRHDKEMRELFEYLMKIGEWQAMQDQIKEMILSDLSSVESPEDAYKIAIQVQLLPRLFGLLEESMTR